MFILIVHGMSLMIYTSVSTIIAMVITSN